MSTAVITECTLKDNVYDDQVRYHTVEAYFRLGCSYSS